MTQISNAVGRLKQYLLSDTPSFIDLSSLADIVGLTNARMSAVIADMDHFPEPSGVNEWPTAPAINALLIEASLEGDEKRPLPRGAGADAPQSEHQEGDIGLMYTEQNFNELAAANAVMQTEISGFAEKEAMWRDRIDEMSKSVDDLRFSVKSAQSLIKDQQQAIDAGKRDLVEAEADRDYQRDLAISLQRKLDRALGYLDSVLDKEEGYREPATMKGPLPAIGPDFDDVPPPRRRQTGGHAHSGFADMMPMGDVIRMSGDSRSERPRRYR